MKKIVVLGFVGLAVSTLLNSCTKCDNGYLTDEQKSIFQKEGTKMIFRTNDKFDTVICGKPNITMEYTPGMITVCKDAKYETITQILIHSDTSIANVFNLKLYKQKAPDVNDLYINSIQAGSYDKTIQYDNKTFNDVYVFNDLSLKCNKNIYGMEVMSYKHSRSAGLLELTICDSNKTKTLSRLF